MRGPFIHYRRGFLHVRAFGWLFEIRPSSDRMLFSWRYALLNGRARKLGPVAWWFRREGASPFRDVP